MFDRRPSAARHLLACAWLAVAAAGCGGETAEGDAPLGSAPDAGAADAPGATTDAGDCWQAATMLDVSQAPGAGPGYEAPTLAASCDGDRFVVRTNQMPGYTFVQTTPSPLHAAPIAWSIPRVPVAAAAPTELALLGPIGFAVNGLTIAGPNEAATPADTAYGDPVYNGLMDPCFGHTAGSYHYHSLLEQCLVPSGLVAEPWAEPAPDPGAPSPVLGWALDGYPIYGARECADAACAAVVELQSGWEKVGDPKTYAWKAYAWKAHPDDATRLDACNGHTGPGGDYHYHATSGFPYVLGCYHGSPVAVGMGPGMGGPGMGGPGMGAPGGG
jgi:hypothetical protein